MLTSNPNGIDRIDSNHSIRDYKSSEDSSMLSDFFEKLYDLRKYPLRVAGMRPSNYQKTKIYDRLQKGIRKNYISFAEKREGLKQSFSDRVKDIDELYEKNLISLPQYYSMLDQALKDCDKIETKIASATNDANAKINNLSSNVSSKVESYSKEEDAILKKKLLFIFLIAAPFLNIPYLEGMMDPLTNLFDPSKTMGETVSDMVKSESLGEFGKFLDFIMVDDFMKWIFDDSPVVSDLVNLSEGIFENELVRGTLGIIREPFFLVAPYALSAGSSMLLIDQQTKIHKLKSSIEKAVKKESDELSDDLSKGLDKVSKESAKESAKNMIKALKKANQIEEIFKSLKSNQTPEIGSSEFKELFKGIDLVKDLKKSDFTDYKDPNSAKKNQEALAKLFSLSDDQLKEVEKRINHCESLYMEKIYDDLLNQYHGNLPTRNPRFDSYFEYDPSNAQERQKSLQEFVKEYRDDVGFRMNVERSVSPQPLVYVTQDYGKDAIEELKYLTNYFSEENQSKNQNKLADDVLSFVDHEIEKCYQLDDESTPNQHKIFGKTTKESRIKELEKQRQEITDALDVNNKDQIDKAIESWAEKQIMQNLFHAKIDPKIVPSSKEIGYGNEPINFGKVSNPKEKAGERLDGQISFAKKVQREKSSPDQEAMKEMLANFGR